MRRRFARGQRKFVRGWTLFFVLSVLVIYSLTFASEKDILNIQGIVMEIDLKKNTMIVNEKLFRWDQKTSFFNDKGSPITIDKIKVKSWVYIEGVNDIPNKSVLTNKVYLLPKRINEKEKHLYPFLK